MARPKFSREFNIDAVRLFTDRGVAVAQAARDLAGGRRAALEGQKAGTKRSMPPARRLLSFSRKPRRLAEVFSLHVKHHGRALVGERVRDHEAYALAPAGRGHNLRIREGLGHKEGALRFRGAELSEGEAATRFGEEIRSTELRGERL